MVGLLRGAKISSSHQTYIKAAKPVINVAKKLDEVKKIIIGPIQVIHGKTRCVRIIRTETSIQVDIYAGNEKQTLWMIGDRNAICDRMKEFE